MGLKSHITNYQLKDNPVLNSLPETGKPIPEYEELYEVSSYGRVSNYRKIMKTYQINSGYHALKLIKNGIRKSVLIHRLVAECFIPNPENKPEVNHIDGDKGNNRIDNLEWVTSSENKSHAYKTGLRIYNEPYKGVKKSDTASKFHNVSWDNQRQKWIGSISYNNKRYKQKRFDNEIDAAQYVNTLLDELGLTDRPRNQV